MRLIDTHTHIYCEEFNSDRAQVIERARQAGIVKMLFPAIDSDTYSRQSELAHAYPNLFSQMMGLHPTSVDSDYLARLELARNLLFSAPDEYVAVGEIGLDFYWDTTFALQQQEVFKEQLRWAQQLNKPVSVHIRDAYDEALQIMLSDEFLGIRGVLHCFSGTLEQAFEAVDKGFYLGIGGVVTFKKSHLPEIIRSIPLSHIVLETDSPYLAPVPHRGTRNESAYIADVAVKIGDILELAPEEVANQTSLNAERLFSLA